MPTTTNYGWTTPADTDLVKDGAAAIRTLGSSIDTTLKTQIDAQIPDSLLTTTGDIIYASGASTPARLGIGTTGQALVVSGGLPAWGTVAAGGMTSIASGSFSGSLVTISGISQSYKNLVLVLRGVQQSVAGDLLLRLNNVSTSIYNGTYVRSQSATLFNKATGTYWSLEDLGTVNGNASTGVITINDYASATAHAVTLATQDPSTNGRGTWATLGNSTSGLIAAITRIDLSVASGTFSSGTYILYGVN